MGHAKRSANRNRAGDVTDTKDQWESEFDQREEKQYWVGLGGTGSAAHGLGAHLRYIEH